MFHLFLVVNSCCICPLQHSTAQLFWPCCTRDLWCRSPWLCNHFDATTQRTKEAISPTHVWLWPEFPSRSAEIKSGFPFSASCSFQQLLNIISTYHCYSCTYYSISLRQIQSRIAFISSFLFVLLLATPVVEFQQKPKHQAPEALRDAFSNERCFILFILGYGSKHI